MKSSILDFFLLVLGIPLDLALDTSHKQVGFSKTLPKKSLKFVLSKKDGIVTFNLSFVLLPMEVNLVLEKKNCKKDAFIAYNSGRVKIIFTLSIEVIALYIQAFIVQVKILSLENSILEGELFLAILLALDK